MTHTLVDRLRDRRGVAPDGFPSTFRDPLCHEAADILASYHSLAQAAGFTGDDPVGEALRAILVKDAALEPFALVAGGLGIWSNLDRVSTQHPLNALRAKHFRNARQALANGGTA